jgi:chemotaxis protein CheX
VAQTQNRILVAVDDQSLAGELQQRLEGAGYAVAATSNGFKATSLLDASVYAGLIVSTKLEGSAGLQVAENARRVKAQAGMAIVVVSGQADAAVQARAAQISGAQLLVGPQGAADVVQALLQALERGRKAPSVESYDVRIINAFISAVSETIGFYVPGAPVVGKPRVKPGDAPQPGPISSVISFTGEKVKGSMAINFDRETLRLVAVQALPGVDASTDPALADLAGELANQVCGAVKSQLLKLGLKTMIGLPKVIIGERHLLIHVVKNPVISMPLEVAKHAAALEFCMTKNDEPLDEPAADESMQAGDAVLF